MLEKYIPGKGCNKIRVHFLFFVKVLLLLLPTTSVLKRREVLLFFLVAVLLLLFTHREGCAEKIYIGFCFLFDTGAQSNRVQSDWVRTAALSHSPRFLLTTLVLKQREVPATFSSFHVFVPYTAMLRTSTAAVVLRCFSFCPLDCDASVMVVDYAAVDTGCMPEKYMKVFFSVSATTTFLCVYSIAVAAVEKG